MLALQGLLQHVTKAVAHCSMIVSCTRVVKSNTMLVGRALPSTAGKPNGAQLSGVARICPGCTVYSKNC